MSTAIPACAALAAFRDQPSDVRRDNRQQVRRSLRASVKDGIAWSVMQGGGQQYVTPFVILGGAGLLPLAALAALPSLAGAIVQQIAAEVADRCGSRKRLFVGAGTLQVILWVSFATAIFLPSPYQYWLMLGTYVLFMGGHHLSLPPWFSTMGDLVPSRTRGRYFGYRNFLSGVVMIAAFLGGGAWVSFCEQHGELALLGLSSQNFGFLTLFIIAGVSRAVSVGYLRQMREPEYRPRREDRFTLVQFTRRMPHSPFGRFVMYRMLLHAGYVLVLPYLSWYMLDQLSFSPVLFAAIMTANLGANFCAQWLFGGVADRMGAKRLVAIGGWGLVATPALLMVSSAPWYFAVVQLFDGTMLAALSVGATNYVLEVVTPAKRARCAAYSNFYLGIGGAIGAFGGALLLLSGGSVIAAMPAVLGDLHPFHVLLFVSVVVRGLPNLMILPTFHEARLGNRRVATV